MSKRIISIIILIAFFVTLVPAPPALALRQEVADGRAIGGIEQEIRAAKGAGEAVSTSGGMNGVALKGVIFDLDGTLVTTEKWHYLAWKKLIEEVLMENGIDGEFTEKLDNKFTSGVPKYHGVIRVLKHFEVKEFMCLGDYSIDPQKDPEGYEKLTLKQKQVNDKARELADKKQKYFEEIISKNKIEQKPGVLTLIDDFKAKGLKIAVATGSEIPELLLRQAGIPVDLFDDIVCSRDEGGENTTTGELIKGKTGIVGEAAARLGLKPQECIGVDDAISGVEAFKDAGMMAVVGIAQTERELGPIKEKADLTVMSLEEMSFTDFEKLFKDINGLAAAKEEITAQSVVGSNLSRPQQDAYLDVDIDIPDVRHGKGQIIAVVDGHGEHGDRAAEFIRNCIENFFKLALEEEKGDIDGALSRLFRNLNTLASYPDDPIFNYSGAVVSMCYISYDEAQVYVAVLGDCPVIIKDANGNIIKSPEHNVVLNEAERKAAIEQRGAVYYPEHSPGHVWAKSSKGGEGLIGYAVQFTRSLGDMSVDSILNREPDIYNVSLGDGSFVFIGSDGVFDALEVDHIDNSNKQKERIDRVVHFIAAGKSADEIAQDAVRRKTGDNVTAVLWRAAAKGAGEVASAIGGMKGEPSEAKGAGNYLRAMLPEDRMNPLFRENHLAISWIISEAVTYFKEIDIISLNLKIICGNIFSTRSQFGDISLGYIREIQTIFRDKRENAGECSYYNLREGDILFLKNDPKNVAYVVVRKSRRRDAYIIIAGDTSDKNDPVLPEMVKLDIESLDKYLWLSQEQSAASSALTAAETAKKEVERRVVAATRFSAMPSTNSANFGRR